MIDPEPNDLEGVVNQYLDGELTDEQLESYLRDRPESLDIDQIRAFKSRVERIEELYRQIEEPKVPDGYWDNFADRVTARLPATEERSLASRLADILIPTRWPRAAFGYVGAIASIALVLVIGRSMMKSGRVAYEPTPTQEVRQEADKSITQPEAGAKAAPEEQKVELKAKEPPKSTAAGVPTPIAERELKKDAVDQSEEKSIQIAVRSQVVEPNAGEIQPQSVTVQAEPLRESEPVVVESQDQPSQPAKVELPRNEIVTGEKPRTESPDEAISIVRGSKDLMEMNKPSSLTDIAPKQGSSKPSAVMSLSDSRAVSGKDYDSWDLARLREELASVQPRIADSSYTSPAFADFAELLSAIAIRSGDSTEIDRAVNAIDTLFKYNPNIDSALWTSRRNALESIRIEIR